MSERLQHHLLMNIDTSLDAWRGHGCSVDTRVPGNYDKHG